MAMAIVNNNIPFAAADTFNWLFKDIFFRHENRQSICIRKDEDDMHCERGAEAIFQVK